jgi:hypothetical protein
MSLANIDTNQILMGILGSLVGYVFYGHINLEAKVSVHDIQMKQGISERKDIWNKYNDAGEAYMIHMIEDAREKEQIKEQLLQVRLEESNRELQFYKSK